MRAYLSFASIVEAATAAPPQPATSAGAGIDPSASADAARATNTLVINALDYGYEPRVVRATAGQPVKLSVVTNNTYGCTRAFVIPTLNIEEILPESGTTTFDLPPQQAGTIRFTCSMGMYRGQIRFE